MRQAQRSFVERLDFRTSPGHSGDPEHDRARGWSGSGPTSVVTDLGTYGFDEASGEMTLRTLHPGVTIERRAGEHGVGAEGRRRPRRDAAARPRRSSGSSGPSSTPRAWPRREPRLPPRPVAGAAARRPGRRRLDRGCGRPAVPRRGRRRDRRERRSRRSFVDRGDGRTGLARLVRPRHDVHDRRRSRTTRTTLAPLLPMDDARIYPVSGGSEAVETALKLARAYHVARGDEQRTLVIGRRASYHGNTLGALDAGGKEVLRRPYEPWLGRFAHVEPAYEYRCAIAVHPGSCGGRPRRGARARDRRGRVPAASRRSSPSPSPARRSRPPCRPTTTGRRSSRCAAGTVSS